METRDKSRKGIVENDNAVDELERDYASRVEPLIRRAMNLGAWLRNCARDEAIVFQKAEEATWKPADVFVPGDRVVMTGRALRSMGVRSGEAVTKVWTIRECECELCRSGRLVCTDQECGDGSGWRHISCAALRHEGQPTVDELPVGISDMGSTSRGIERGFKTVEYKRPTKPSQPVTTAEADADALAAFEAAGAVPMPGLRH